MLPLLLLTLTGLPETFEKVDPAVVTVRVATRRVVETDSSRVLAVNIGTGSGVLVHAEGFVVTAAHVVDDAQVIEVHWRDGFSSQAQVVSLSRTEDLALLKVAEAPPKAVVATLGNSDALKPGQRLFAIGAPYGLEHSLSAGVVSALRSTPRRGLVPQRLIQTDLALNQGNSGGPLFNDKGEVVGIASFMLSQSGGSVGLNFAVPSSIVRARLFDEALPYIGVTLRYLPKDVVELFNWPFDGGFLVEAVQEDSVAAKAGLKGGEVDAVVGSSRVKLGGDFIVKVNGVSATETAKVAEVLRKLKPGQQIQYEVLRGGQLGTLEVPVPAGVSVPRLAKAR